MSYIDIAYLVAEEARRLKEEEKRNAELQHRVPLGWTLVDGGPEEDVIHEEWRKSDEW